MKPLILKLLIVFAALNSCKAQTETATITIIDIETIQKEVINKKNVQFIDVRTPLEYKQGHIGTAINANFYTSTFFEVATTLDKSKPVYLYCHKGGRSHSAAKKLVKLGFTEVYDFKGGWKAWNAYLETNK